MFLKQQISNSFALCSHRSYFKLYFTILLILLYFWTSKPRLGEQKSDKKILPTSNLKPFFLNSPNAQYFQFTACCDRGIYVPGHDRIFFIFYHERIDVNKQSVFQEWSEVQSTRVHEHTCVESRVTTKKNSHGKMREDSAHQQSTLESGSSCVCLFLPIGRKSSHGASLYPWKREQWLWRCSETRSSSCTRLWFLQVRDLDLCRGGDMTQNKYQ